MVLGVDAHRGPVEPAPAPADPQDRDRHQPIDEDAFAADRGVRSGLRRIGGVGVFVRPSWCVLQQQANLLPAVAGIWGIAS